MSCHSAHADSSACAERKLVDEHLAVLSHASAVQCVDRVSHFQTLKETTEKVDVGCLYQLYGVLNEDFTVFCDFCKLTQDYNVFGMCYAVACV